MRAPPARAVPPTLTEDGRRSFSEIATRARTEHVHGYAVLCLGLQTHLSASRLSSPSHTLGSLADP